MNRQLLWILGSVLLVILAIFIGRAMIGDSPRSYYDDPHKEKLIAELKVFLADPLARITLEKENPWDKWDFEYSIAEAQELQKFTAAALQADPTPPSQQGAPVLGTIMTLTNNKASLRFIATLHRNHLEDLYISNVFPVETTPGTFKRGPGKEVRLPGLGRWIMTAAPAACGAALRDKCAKGELQPEDIE